MSRDISPSKEALSNRNLTLLLESLSKKETRKSIEALSKIDKDEWRDMAATATQLKSFVDLGGISSITTTLTESVKNTIELQIDKFLSPLQNNVNQAIAEILNPFLEIFTPVISDLTTFLADNAAGAGVGGIAGLITSKFLPGGSIWLIIGSLVGSIFEDELTKYFAGESSAFGEVGYFWTIIARLWERAWGWILGTGGGGGDDPSLPGRIGGFQDNF